jgi:hypothetical protein
MATRYRQRGGRNLKIAVGHVVVGVAQSRGAHPDEQLVLLWRGKVYLDDFPFARGLEQDGCHCLHAGRSFARQ